MATIKADVYFQDEAPRIGAGWRRVTIKIGRERIRVTELATGKAVRLPIKVLDQVKWKGITGRV